MSKGFIPPHGGYKNLLSYRKAVIVYDATYRFCERFLIGEERLFMTEYQRAGRILASVPAVVDGTGRRGEGNQWE